MAGAIAALAYFLEGEKTVKRNVLAYLLDPFEGTITMHILEEGREQGNHHAAICAVLDCDEIESTNLDGYHCLLTDKRGFFKQAEYGIAVKLADDEDTFAYFAGKGLIVSHEKGGGFRPPVLLTSHFTKFIWSTSSLLNKFGEPVNIRSPFKMVEAGK